MNINRNNYEEYFLLYADKELSAQEKNLVEMFVKQNPDLEEEFVMLQQSVIKADFNIKLEDKSSLFKGEGEFINLNNYEEKFLLFADNELSLPEVEETEKFVLSNPSLQNEFTLLQHVKYQPDASIIFPDKSILYRKEEDVKVIPFRWKALAAAILLGLGLWTGINYLQQQKADHIAVTTPVPNKKPNTKPYVEQKNDLASTQKDRVVPEQKLAQGKSAEVKNTQSQSQPQQNVLVKNITPAKVPEDVKSSKEPQEIIIAENNPNKNAPAKMISDIQNKIAAEPNSKTVANIIAPESNNAQTASYITEAEEKSENYVFYNITQEEFQKSKVGIFFKRVKRLVERKNPLREKSFKVSSLQEIPNN